MYQGRIPLLLTVLLLAALSVSRAQEKQGDRTRAYISPDRALVATVSRSEKNKGEDRVQVALHSGNVWEILCSEDCFSSDGEHGFAVAKAGWTPDSKYFVYSLESSGGHSVIVIPTMFCSRLRKRIFNLGELVDESVVLPDFKLSAPNAVTVTLQSLQREKTIDLQAIEPRDSTTLSWPK